MTVNFFFKWAFIEYYLINLKLIRKRVFKHFDNSFAYVVNLFMLFNIHLYCRYRILHLSRTVILDLKQGRLLQQRERHLKTSRFCNNFFISPYSCKMCFEYPGIKLKSAHWRSGKIENLLWSTQTAKQVSWPFRKDENCHEFNKNEKRSCEACKI